MTQELRYQPALEAIEALLADEEEELLMIAIDGRCGSGKSTFAEYLSRKYDANVFHLDDFYPQPFQRTEERLSEPGGNLDYERFREEVLIPVWYGDPVLYRPFDCRLLDFAKEQEQLFPPKRLNIFEGSYSQHPYFGNPYQLRIFMDIDEKTQLANILKRNGEEKLALFQTLWIPREEKYFAHFDIKGQSDLILPW